MKKHLKTMLLVGGALACFVAGASATSLAGASAGGPSRVAGNGAAAGLQAEDDVIARVNGVPITEMDLKLKLENDSHEAVPSAERRGTVLQSLIQREVLAQKARAEGLDKDPKYMAMRRLKEAQMGAFERQELAELLLAREAEKRSAPTEESARAFFAANEQHIRTRVHVMMILRRSEAAIIEARSAIDRGKSFEEVAESLLPGGLPEGKKPWDLGYLSFQQVPAPWRETVYDLKPGEMSGVLRGPNERFWLVKLVESRVDPDVTFESARAAIESDMAVNRVQRTREELQKELLLGARIEMVKPAP